jgi:hypothetical protein
MSSTYSPDLRIELIGTGDQAGVWGATTNNNMAYVLEQAIAGYVSVAVASANQALTYINGATATAADNQSVHASLALTTSTGANFAVYAPPASKQYTIYNASSYVATIYNSTVIGNTTAAGTGVAIPAGKTMTVWSDGTNFTQQNTHLISPTIASATLTTPALGTPSSGTLTNCTGLPVATGISGLGSGVATFLATPSSANLASAVSDETGSGALVFANSPTLVTPALGTPASGNLANCTFPTLNQNTTGSAATLTTGRTISLTGDVTGTTGSFNGSAAVSASTTIANSAVTTAKVADANITAAKLDGAQSGSAPIFGARAWANFVGDGSNGACTVNASGNVSGVVKNNTGDYTVTFNTAMADANYAVTVFGSALISRTSITSQAAGSIRFTIANATDNINSASVQIMVIR